LILLVQIQRVSTLLFQAAVEIPPALAVLAQVVPTVLKLPVMQVVVRTKVTTFHVRITHVVVHPKVRVVSQALAL
jgi:hypothetical protein